MPKKTIIILIAILSIGLLVSCQSQPEEPFVGAMINGDLNQDEPGSRMDFMIEVENEGDPIGIDFRGILRAGSIKLQIVNAEGPVYQEWAYNQLGAFSLNATLYPPPGIYRLGMVWNEAVQLAQYSLTWRPSVIESPIVTTKALLPGIGMMVVALGFVIYAAVHKLGWGYLFLGALGWGITVTLKFAWAIPVNTSVYQGLMDALPETVASLIFYLYVGALTGIFEVAIIWLVLRYTMLGKVGWERALAFGIGFGAVEALLLGVVSLVNAVSALVAPDMFPLSTLEQLTLTNNLLYGLAPVWERFFTILVHIFSNVLVFYGVQKRETRWFWLAFVYKSGIDAIATFAQFWGLNTLGCLWTIEAIVAFWGLVGGWGIHVIKMRYPAPNSSAQTEDIPIEAS